MGAAKAEARSTGRTTVAKKAGKEQAKSVAKSVVKKPAVSSKAPAKSAAKTPFKASSAKSAPVKAAPVKAAAAPAKPAAKAAPVAAPAALKNSVKVAAVPAGKSANKSMETPPAADVKSSPKPAPAASRPARSSVTGRLLTEEEVIKAPESEYMNDAQLAFFRDRLQSMERDILRNAGETTEHLRETIIVPDPADRATIEEEHALELRTRDRERKLLKKIQQSIARIDSGDYGYCEETGEPIGVLRLLARPTATLSLEAQQRREMKQKLYGD